MIYRITMRSKPDGQFAASWFDNRDALWDDERLHKSAPIAHEWQPPRLVLLRGRATPVLFNPDAIAVDESIVAILSKAGGLEFLPVEIEEVGRYFIVHVVTTHDPPQGCRYRRGPDAGNIIEVFAMRGDFRPITPFFRLRQPADSSAGAAGFVVRDWFATQEGADLVTRACRPYLNIEPRS